MEIAEDKVKDDCITIINALCDLADSARYKEDILALEQVGEIFKQKFYREPKLREITHRFYAKLYFQKNMMR